MKAIVEFSDFKLLKHHKKMCNKINPKIKKPTNPVSLKILKYILYPGGNLLSFWFKYFSLNSQLFFLAHVGYFFLDSNAWSPYPVPEIGFSRNT